MSYHDGIFIPPLIVTGLLGAFGRIHLTPGKRFDAAMSSGRKLHPAPLSPYRVNIIIIRQGER